MIDLFSRNKHAYAQWEEDCVHVREGISENPVNKLTKSVISHVY